MKLSATTGMEFERLRDEVMRAEKRVVSLSGLTSVAAKAFFLSRLQAETGKSLVIVTDSNQEMEMWTSDLEFFRSRISNFESEISNLKSKFEISNLRIGNRHSYEHNKNKTFGRNHHGQPLRLGNHAARGRAT